MTQPVSLFSNLSQLPAPDGYVKRTCVRCGDEKSASLFQRLRNGKRHNHCRECMKELSQAEKPAAAESKRCLRCHNVKPIAEFLIITHTGTAKERSCCDRCRGYFRARHKQEAESKPESLSKPLTPQPWYRRFWSWLTETQATQAETQPDRRTTGKGRPFSEATLRIIGELNKNPNRGPAAIARDLGVSRGQVLIVRHRRRKGLYKTASIYEQTH